MNNLFSPLKVDLFASRLSTHLRVYYSWWPDLFARCLLPELEGLCKPRLEPDRSSPVSNTSTTSTNRTYSTGLEDLLSVLTNHPRLLTQGDWIVHNLHQSGNVTAPVGHVAHLRERYQGQNLSKDLLLKTKTNKSYDSLFGKWASWCHQQSCDPFLGPVTEVANFLAHLFAQEYQYNSINTYRSAISSAHEKEDGYNVGQHPLITRLLKGIFYDKPPLPKYSVLDYLGKHIPNDSLLLKQLTIKTVMLLALTHSSRSVDLAQLNITAKQYKFCSSLRLSRQGKPISGFFFPYPFLVTQVICPVKCLSAYKSMTSGLQAHEGKLFISFIKPHHAVSSSSITYC